MAANSFMSIIIFALVIVLILIGFKTPNVAKHRLKWFQVDYGTAPILGVLVLVATFSIDHHFL